MIFQKQKNPLNTPILADGLKGETQGRWSVTMSDAQRIERLSAMLKRRGIILPAFEIYGGLSGFIDYGPVGARIRRRVIENWIDHWTSHGNIVEINSPTITPEPVLVASGHVGEFNDLMTECGKCTGAFRADQLVKNVHSNPESLNSDEIDAVLLNENISCPNCAEQAWTPARPMNLMFSTTIGAMKSTRQAYMRPETAQGMFMLYPSLYRHFRQKLPFGAIQTGKGYRNEISPRQGMIRLREFNMAELEYFIDPENPPTVDLTDRKDLISFIPDPFGSNSEPCHLNFANALNQGIIKHPTVAWFLARTWDFLVGLGIDSARIRFRQHESTEMAHYASDCWDCEIHGEHGWIECVGIANRTCHDLQQHEAHSTSKSLRAWRDFESPRKEVREVLSPNTAVIGPVFKGQAGAIVTALGKLTELLEPPFDLKLADGSTVEITAEMVTPKTIETSVAGEWFTPHVIEPAFGIDRIIWHILDHSYSEIEKSGEDYTVLRLAESVAPSDVIILPLFDKDGMGEIARKLTNQINSIRMIKAEFDNSKSIGRRYARADEIGIPWAITVDHTTTEDLSVTIRRRDDQKQIRATIDDVIDSLTKGNLGSMF